MIRSAIISALLCALLAAASIPAAAQTEPVADEGDPLTMAEASAAALLHAMEATPDLTWPDAPVPASLAEYMPAAREQVWDHAYDTFPWPLYLRFVEARCNDEGAVALIFEEIRPLLPWRTYASAMRGAMPTSVDDGWMGGTGMASALDDPEFIYQMGSDSYACPR